MARCPECNGPLSETVTEGLCSKCLMEQGLKFAGEFTTASEAPVPDGLPREFGDYEFIEEIARGGMGIVYRARQRSLGRLVAVKLLLLGPHASPEYVQRFRAEASTAASLHHPNIVTIHHVGVHQGEHYLVMDLVDGPNLAHFVRDRPLSARRAAGYLKTISEAVHYAHTRSILHRDLKPSNVLIDSNDQPWVTDFGLAKRLEGDSSLTLSGRVLGSPSYMPPEQAGMTRHKVGRRSDVYSLGALLYHLMVGRPPFVGEDLNRTLDLVLHHEPLSPRSLCSAVPCDLETICLKCLEKEPARRYPTAQAVAEELGRFLRNEPILARPVGPWERAWRWCRRNPQLAFSVASLLAVFLIGFAAVTWAWGSEARARDAERRERQRAELNLYCADMRLAQVALGEDNLRTARTLLQRHLPKPGEADLRGFEWRYLRKQCCGDESASFKMHGDASVWVSVSPAGGLLASIDSSGAIKVLDTSSGGLRATLCGFTDELRAFEQRSVAFSPHGKFLISKSGDTIVVWDTTNWQELARLEHLFSPGFPAVDDSQMIAWTGEGIKLWDTGNWRQLEIPQGEWDRFGFPVVFSSDGRILLAAASFGTGDRQMQVWDLQSRKVLAEFLNPVQGGNPYSVAISDSGAVLAAGKWDGQLTLYETATGNEIASCKAHTSYITSVAFSRDGKSLVSGGADQVIRLWDVTTLKQIAAYRGHLGTILSTAFTPDGKTLVSSSSDGAIKMWGTQRQSERTELAITIYPLWFSPDGTELATVNSGAVVQTWNVPTGRAKREQAFPSTNESVLLACMSEDGRILAAGERDGTVRTWDPETGTSLGTYPGHHSFITSIKISSGNRLLAAASEDSVRVWDLATGTEQASFRDASWDMAFAPNGKFLARAGTNHTVRLWDFTTKKDVAVMKGHRDRVWRVAFSPDGSLLASSSADATARLWAVPSGQQVAVLTGHRQSLTYLDFSPDGRTLATGSIDHTVRLWNVGCGQEMLTLGEYGEDIGPILFSPKGDTLAVGRLLIRAGDKPVHLWRAPSFAEIGAAEGAMPQQ